MRNPNRIKPFMEWLTREWEKHPDYRFGQFLINTGIIPDDQVMWNTDVDEKFYTRDDLLLIYNEAYSNIRFKNEKYKFCKFLLFIQIYDRRRIEFELPCCFNEQKSEIIDFLKDYVKVLHVAAVKKLTQGGLICLKKF